MYNIWLVQRVRWAEPLATPQSCFLHTHFTIQTYRGILYPMEALGSRRLSPGLLPASAGILDLGGKQDDDVRNSFVGHQRGHSDSWLALLPEIMEE